MTGQLQTGIVVPAFLPKLSSQGFKFVDQLSLHDNNAHLDCSGVRTSRLTTARSGGMVLDSVAC